MEKEYLIKKLLLESTQFTFSLEETMKKVFEANIDSIIASLELFRQNDDFDHLLEMRDLYQRALNITLKDYISQCAGCEGWVMQDDIIYDEYEDRYLCQDCFDTKDQPDCMTVAHNFKEENI